MNLACRREGVFKAHFNDTDQFVFLQPHARGICIFFMQRGVKHSGVVGGEDDGDSVAKELRERMILNSCILATELFGEGGSFHVAPWTDFKRYLSFRKEVH